MSNIHLRAFTHPALALHIFYCVLQSLGMKAQQVVPACREKATLEKDGCTHWGEMKTFTNVLEKPGTAQMGNMIWRISQLNELKRKIRNDPGIISLCAKVTVTHMHQPQPCQEIHSSVRKILFFYFFVSAAKVAPTNRKVIYKHGFVLRKTIHVRVIMIFKNYSLKTKIQKRILLTLTRNSTGSLLYVSAGLSVWKEKGGRVERQARRKSGSLKCALWKLCIQLLPFSYCCSLQNSSISVPGQSLLLCFWKSVPFCLS